MVIRQQQTSDDDSRFEDVTDDEKKLAHNAKIRYRQAITTTKLVSRLAMSMRNIGGTSFGRSVAGVMRLRDEPGWRMESIGALCSGILGKN
jgi:hypothetical protein